MKDYLEAWRKPGAEPKDSSRARLLSQLTLFEGHSKTEDISRSQVMYFVTLDRQQFHQCNWVIRAIGGTQWFTVPGSEKSRSRGTHAWFFQETNTFSSQVAFPAQVSVCYLKLLGEILQTAQRTPTYFIMFERCTLWRRHGIDIAEIFLLSTCLLRVGDWASQSESWLNGVSACSNLKPISRLLQHRNEPVLFSTCLGCCRLIDTALRSTEWSASLYKAMPVS